MKQAAFTHFDLPWLPLTGLIIFVTCFAMYIYYTYKKSNKPFFEKAAQIPLDDPRIIASEERK